MPKKNVLISTIFMAFCFVLPLATKASVDLSSSCPISIDNDTSDWENVDPLFSKVGTTEGIPYYWDGNTWQTSEPSSWDYSTNVEQMSILENIKGCNDTQHLKLYVDSQHPLFGVYNYTDQKYEEFPDPSESNMGMPQGFDYWMVFEMQKQNSDNIYYFAVHLVSELGDPGLENGPAKIALYEDNGDGIFSDVDTELVDFDTQGGKDSYEGDDASKGKEFDQAGGLEFALDLINEDGDGVFTSTDINYGDTLIMSVAMYPNNAVQSLSTQRVIQSVEVEQTDDFEYKLKKVGVQNVRVPTKKKFKKQVTVKWDEVDNASKYIIKLYLGNKYKRTIKTTSTQKVLKKLTYKKNKYYNVKIRAKISSIYTPWSDKINFKTKKK